MLFGLAAVLGAAVLAACGGSDDNDSVTNPGSKNYDPAKTALANAGLEVCSEEQKDISTQLSQVPGLALTRSFDVAQDCNGATVTANKVTIFQFTNKDDFTAGVQSCDAKRLIDGLTAGTHEQDHRQRGVESGHEAFAVVEYGLVEIAGVDVQRRCLAGQCGDNIRLRVPH